MVEGARLESVYAGNRIAGSNPAPSATRSRALTELLRCLRACDVDRYLGDAALACSSGCSQRNKEDESKGDQHERGAGFSARRQAADGASSWDVSRHGDLREPRVVDDSLAGPLRERITQSEDGPPLGSFSLLVFLRMAAVEACLAGP